MELAELIAELSRPEAYRFAVDRVAVCQTHISVVFLAGPFAYKIKKPLNLGFLDFATLEKRRFYCQEEVRLNRRLAPDVYLDVVPVTKDGDKVRMEGTGPALEWAVKMRRLPEEATLLARLRRDQLDAGQLHALARHIAGFHARAAAGPEIAAFGRFDVVAGNARENFTQTQDHIGITVNQTVHQRLRELTEQALERLRPLIMARAERGEPRDTHGDLHLDHVYYFPDQPPLGDWVIVDCIEFNERFRYADPVADMAFLVMDLSLHGRRDLARSFAAAYFAAAGDGESEQLLPFYAAYRAMVRAKVKGMTAAEPEVPEADRQRAVGKAQAYWLLALTELAEPKRRPGLLLVGGLPGAGKSTLAHALAERLGWHVIRSDLVRKELARQAGYAPQPEAFGTGIYASEWTTRTYQACLRQAENRLRDGQRVLIDASFRAEEHRRWFLDAASRLGVPGLLLLCQADPEVIRPRLAQRRDDPSDADWDIHQQAAARWEPASPATQRHLHIIDTNGDVSTALEQALRAVEGCLG